MYQKADHIVPVTHSFKQYIMGHGKPSQLISTITNGADLDCFTGRKRSSWVRQTYELENKFVVSFIGTHGMAHALDTVLKTAQLLKQDPSIVFMLVGDGAQRDRLLNEKYRLGLDNVLMIPQQEKKVVPDFIFASDACLVLLKKSDLFKTVIPSKIFEIMAMKRPIILGVEGESKEIIQKAACGICIEPENPNELAQAILSLKKDPSGCRKLGEKGRRFVTRHYNRDALADKYLQVIRRFEPTGLINRAYQ